MNIKADATALRAAAAFFAAQTQATRSIKAFGVAMNRLRGLEGIQVRFPRSKKRRIRNKWANDPRNWAKVNQ